MGDSRPIPIVVCGRAEIVGRPVVEGLKPEYDVILFCLGSQATAAEVPYVLKGLAPPSQSSYIGSGNYASPPVAVVMGAAWDAADVELVHTAMRVAPGVPATKAPVILRNDTSVPAPQPPAPEYAAQLIRRIRETLGRLVREGEEQLTGPGEGVVTSTSDPISRGGGNGPTTDTFNTSMNKLN
ncbi:hypothetical protein GGS26DRAFT_585814 [Hypomontagnella submonticulosa]|nr:hypothetical protein GGS26DRAFT_585814 [Hypomontagnella submonticulosa]